MDTIIFDMERKLPKQHRYQAILGIVKGGSRTNPGTVSDFMREPCADAQTREHAEAMAERFAKIASAAYDAKIIVRRVEDWGTHLD